MLLKKPITDCIADVELSVFQQNAQQLESLPGKKECHWACSGFVLKECNNKALIKLKCKAI